MKKVILAIAVAMFSFQVGATSQSVCKNKVASGRHDTTNKYNSLLPGSKAAAVPAQERVRTRGTR